MTLPADVLSQVFQRIPAVNQIAGREAYWPIAERLARYNVPGVSVCVIHDGEIAATGGAGAKDDSGAPVDAETIFAGASISWLTGAFSNWMRRSTTISGRGRFPRTT